MIGANSTLANERQLRKLASKLENPLSNDDEDSLLDRGEEYARQNGLICNDDIRAFRIGAVLAKGKTDFDTGYSGEVKLNLTAEETRVLQLETTSRWRGQSWQMILVVIFSAMCAAVQGMGE